MAEHNKSMTEDKLIRQIGQTNLDESEHSTIIVVIVNKSKFMLFYKRCFVNNPNKFGCGGWH